MKKIIALIMCLALCFTFAFALTSCGGDGEEATKGKTLQEVKDAGKLVIATSPDFPPFDNLVGTEVVGIEIDIMQEICEELGVELEIQQIAFDSVLPGVQAFKYDAGVSGITVTDDRKENTLFTDVYYVAAQAIVVKADSSINSKADLEGKKMSAQSGTTAESYCLKEYGSDNVKLFEANADAMLALKNGAVEAWVVDDLTAKQMCKDDASVKILDEKMTEEPYAFAFAFGSEDLVEEINKILGDLIADGTVTSIFAKYGESYEAPAN